MKTSPARRIYQLLRKAHSHSVTQQTTAIVVWAKIFGLEAPEAGNVMLSPDVEDAVMSLLRDVREEVSEVERALSADAEAKEAVAPIAQTLRLITAGQQLHTEWNQVKANHLRADFIAGWQWAAIHLPSVDDEISEDALAKLRAELEALESAAQEAAVPAELRRFVRKQAAAVRNALGRYEVRGTGPLQDAVSLGAGDLILEQEQLRSAVESAPELSATVLSRMKGVWNAAADICGKADNLHKGFLLLMRIYERVQPLLGHTDHPSVVSVVSGGSISV
jgi:hypothetical protein